MCPCAIKIIPHLALEFSKDPTHHLIYREIAVLTIVRHLGTSPKRIYKRCTTLCMRIRDSVLLTRRIRRKGARNVLFRRCSQFALKKVRAKSGLEGQVTHLQANAIQASKKLDQSPLSQSANQLNEKPNQLPSTDQNVVLLWWTVKYLIRPKKLSRRKWLWSCRCRTTAQQK